MSGRQRDASVILTDSRLSNEQLSVPIICSTLCSVVITAKINRVTKLHIDTNNALVNESINICNETRFQSWSELKKRTVAES